MPKNIDELLGDLFGKDGRLRPLSAGEARKSAATAQKAQDALRQMETLEAEMGAQLQSQLSDLKRMTADLDYDRIQRETARDFGVTAQATGGTPRPRAGIEGFEDILPALKAKIFGQDAFLRRLIIAFKRPFVAGFPQDGLKNAIFIHGKPASGRHTAVAVMTDTLHQKGVLASPKVCRIDLSAYPGQGEERLFLQDLYMALHGEGEVVVLDGYAACHPAFLSQLADLVLHGRLKLQSRYVLQNGRLIEAGSALTADIIGSIGGGGKYLILIDEKGPEQLAESFGAPFMGALGDVCATEPFSAQSIAEIVQSKLEGLAETAAQRLGFTLSWDAALAELAGRQLDSEGGVSGVADFCQRLFKALAEYKLEHSTQLGPVALSAELGRPLARFDGQAAPCDLWALLPGGYTGALEAVKAEMARVVGLEEVKRYIFALEDHYKVQAMRRAEGLRAAPVSMHMIFTGNPGTGKTTIARLVARYLKAIGVLSGGQLVEVTRADLVGKYVGHTAPLTTQVIKSAVGGVLFIDEAYSLYRGEQDSFGLEAIDTLVKGMEDNRDDLIVVLAGYSKEMAEFMTANSGLKSRFPNIIEFPDYTGDELLKIANLLAEGKGYTITEQAQGPLLDYFNVIQAMDSRESGNGRLARNVVERAILDQSRRVVAEGGPLGLLLPGDFDLFENGNA